jgi:hypothetical protein
MLNRDQFEISYHLSQVGRIWKACGWSSQKPAQWATQRDEEAIRQWLRSVGPKSKKGCREEGFRICLSIRFLPVVWSGMDLCPASSPP